MEYFEKVQKLEKALHQYDVRSNKKRVDELIHHDFLEIGRGGSTYNKAEIMQCLLTEQRPDYEVCSQEYEFTQLAEDVIQVVYQSANINSDGCLSFFAWRTSIWEKVGDKWQVRFHQGTPTAAFECE